MAHVRRPLRAFTLLELTIVMAIIAILAGLSLISYSGYMSSARDQKRVSDILSFKNGLLQYRLVNPTYPNDTFCNVGQTLVNGGFINGVPYDPGATNCTDSKNSYSYVACGSGARFVLHATLSDPNSTALKDPQVIDPVPGTWNCPAITCSKTGGNYCISE